jgi:dissimilatory sulfite reductase (desulfoviridin) alpha/beta subunit
MPYRLKKIKSGYKVCKPSGKCFSKKPLSLKKAKKQLTALHINTNENMFVKLVLNILAE